MTEIGFNIQIGKLKSVYGEKGFHPARLKVVAKQLKLLTDDDFEIICEDIIANSNTPPTLKDFLKIGHNILHTRRLEQIERDKKLLSESSRCSQCDGDGYVSATKSHEDHVYSYSFRCPNQFCLAAKIFSPPNYPAWSQQFEIEYTKRII